MGISYCCLRFYRLNQIHMRGHEGSRKKLADNGSQVNILSGHQPKRLGRTGLNYS